MQSLCIRGRTLALRKAHSGGTPACSTSMLNRPTRLLIPGRVNESTNETKASLQFKLQTTKSHRIPCPIRSRWGQQTLRPSWGVSRLPHVEGKPASTLSSTHCSDDSNCSCILSGGNRYPSQKNWSSTHTLSIYPTKIARRRPGRHPTTYAEHRRHPTSDSPRGYMPPATLRRPRCRVDGAWLI